MTALKNDRQFEQRQKAFRQWLSSLPSETAEDLVELFRQHSEELDPEIKSDIAQTIQEILMPDMLNVELRKEFELGKESPEVRDRLSKYRMRVGDQIVHWRKERELSQEALADMAGISQSHICRLETGVHVPTFETIEKIAVALDIEPSKLDPGCPDDN